MPKRFDAVSVLIVLLWLGLILCLSGCASSGAAQNVKWYNPATWFSGSEGRAAAKLDAKIETANDKAIGAAQRAVHETSEALAVAGDSRPVSVAKEANSQAVALLDQVAGPLTAGEAAKLREKVRLLTSDLAEERAKGEEMAKKDRQSIERLSGQLEELAALKKRTDADLAKAFERENALANELRNERWWKWFIGISLAVVGVLGFAGWVYVRLTLGGLPTALGRSLNSLRTSNPALAAEITNTLDVHLSPAEQRLVAIMAAKNK